MNSIKLVFWMTVIGPEGEGGDFSGAQADFGSQRPGAGFIWMMCEADGCYGTVS